MQLGWCCRSSISRKFGKAQKFSLLDMDPGRRVAVLLSPAVFSIHPGFPAPAIRVPGTKAPKGCFLFPKSSREVIDMRHKTQSHADWRKRFKRHAFVSTLCVQLRSLWNPSLSSDLHRISKKKYYSDLHSNSQSEHYSVNSTADYIQEVIFSPNKALPIKALPLFNTKTSGKKFNIMV